MESFIGRSIDLMAIKEQRQRKIIFIAGAIVGFAVCVLIAALIYHWYLNREYDTYRVTNSVSVKGGESLQYIAYNGGVIRYGRDGVTAVDEKGNSIWGGSYAMGEPKISTCGTSAVVADIGGTSLYVYKGEDTGIDFSVDYPIVQACISKQGVIAVLMEESSSNTIALYNPFDKTERLLAEIPTNVEDGYPVSIALSPDGTSVIVSYLCVTTGVAQSRVAFYNFSEVGKNANCLVGAHNYVDILISDVQFMNNDYVCLFGENSVFVWQNMKQPKLAWKKEFAVDVQSAFYNDTHVGILLKKDENCDMRVFDLEGDTILTQNVGNEYTQVQISGEEVILNSTTDAVIYRLNGVRKFSGKLRNKISYLFPGTKRNRYVMIQDSKIKYIKLG